MRLLDATYIVASRRGRLSVAIWPISDVQREPEEFGVGIVTKYGEGARRGLAAGQRPDEGPA